MNKLTWLVGIAALTASTTGFADGFYVGGGLGALQFKNSITYDSSLTDTYNYSDSATGRGAGINGTIVVGYAWEDPNSYFLGLEAFNNLSSAKVNSTITGELGDTTETQLKIDDVYGLRILPGIHFTPDTVGYSILGLAHGKMVLSDDIGNSDDYDLDAYQIGVGSMTKLTNNIALRTDLIYTNYGKVIDSVTSSANGMTYTNSSTIEPSTMEANLVAVYKFG